MILCLIGTNPYDFSRLVKKLDSIAPKLKKPIVIQVGNTQYKPINCEFFTFKAKDKLNKQMRDASLIITQGGYGSMTDAIMMNKPLIAVPRLIELGESQDNQVELVKYFESKGYLKACYDINMLEDLIKQTLMNEFMFQKHQRETEIKVSNLIKDFMNEL